MSQGKEPVIERIGMLTKRYPSRSAAARAWGNQYQHIKQLFQGRTNTTSPPEKVSLYEFLKVKELVLSGLKRARVNHQTMLVFVVILVVLVIREISLHRCFHSLRKTNENS